MSMIKVTNLTFSYESSYDNIFDDVSFQIDTNWKLGLTGRNGRGKTTFFKLLMGIYEYSGVISASVVFDYFPYEVSNKKAMTLEVLLRVCPKSEDWELMKELSLMEVSADILYRPFDTLSNGEQTKVLLAALFLNTGHFLLIDEPTNHLDAGAREAVAAYLKRKKGFILVSHDRNFLDNCVDHMIAINKTNIEIQSGNFSQWWQNKQQQDQFETSQNDRLKKDIVRLKQAAARASDWSDQVEQSKIGRTNSGSKIDRGYVGHKAAKMMKRSKTIEERQTKAMKEKSALLKNIESSDELKLSPLRHHSERLINCSEMALFYGEKQLFSPVSFSVMQGQRIVLSGRNGSGKSSILKLLMGTEIMYQGDFSTASGLVISYVSQDTSDLTGSLSDYANQYGIDESLFKAVLRKLDFARVQFDKDIAEYSGGQSKKVLLARSLCEKAHLYIWDEPLNFIDVLSRIQMEELIKKHQPTMLFVEHDHEFCKNIATDTILLSEV